MSILINASYDVFRCFRTQHFLPLLACQKFLHVDSVDLAARKGTRERKLKIKLKNKAKAAVQKTIKIERWNLKKVSEKDKYDRHLTDDNKPTPVDDTYLMGMYREKTYSFADIIKCFAENNHPSVYNVPNSEVIANIELNMQGEKKTRFKENFQRLAIIPHPFEVDKDRTIMVFCKDQEIQNKTIDSGAARAGGFELIKQIQTGDVKPADYEYILAHPNIITELLPIRGLLKKKFPALANGTVDEDIVGLVEKYLSGIVYKAEKSEFQQNFALITSAVGKLDMGASRLEENFDALLKSVDSNRPRREGTFITRCYLQCAPTSERFKADPFLYVEKEKKPVKKGPATVENEDSDSDDEEEQQKSTN